MAGPRLRRARLAVTVVLVVMVVVLVVVVLVLVVVVVVVVVVAAAGRGDGLRVVHVRAAPSAFVHAQGDAAVVDLGGLDAGGKEARVLDGLAVDPEVDEQDDAERDVEGGGDGEEDVAGVGGDGAGQGVLHPVLLPPHQWSH